ncbi:hypothetical protein SOVF_005600, partial [Spinacia oleracea]
RFWCVVACGAAVAVRKIEEARTVCWAALNCTVASLVLEGAAGLVRWCFGSKVGGRAVGAGQGRLLMWR